MTTITYLHPYTQTWKLHTLPSMAEALSMIAFYQSCGSPARLA